MTVPLCIRQGSKINYDSVSVKELDWSAESQVLIAAEHLWCYLTILLDIIRYLKLIYFLNFFTSIINIGYLNS